MFIFFISSLWFQIKVPIIATLKSFLLSSVLKVKACCSSLTKGPACNSSLAKCIIGGKPKGFLIKLEEVRFGVLIQVVIHLLFVPAIPWGSACNDRCP